jgi:hypothetical protein
MTPEERSKQIMAEADKLVAEARRSLEEGERTMRALGVDPTKVRGVTRGMLKDMNEAQAKEYYATLAKDQEEIAREVQHASAPANQPAGGPPRRPRNMV